jgi:hypothetical protein
MTIKNLTRNYPLGGGAARPSPAFASECRGYLVQCLLSLWPTDGMAPASKVRFPPFLTKSAFDPLRSLVFRI